MKPLFLCVLILTLLIGCAPSRGDRGEFDAFLTRLDTENRQSLSWEKPEREKLSGYTPDFQDQLGEFSEEELTALLSSRELTSVTSEEAQDDVTYYFRLLQTTYGGYYYFGGDEVFLPLRESILADLKDTERISAEELGQLLRSRLSDVVVDGHFIIGSNSIINDIEKFMYYVPDLYFDDPSGLDSDYVRPTIGPKGQLSYCFAALSHDGEDLPAETTLSGKPQPLQWQRAEALVLDEDQKQIGYRKTRISDIPVLESRILYSQGGDEETQLQLEELSESGEEYRGLPLLIVDLRHNGGGNSFYAINWVKGFTKRYVQPKVAFFEKCSEPYIMNLEKNPAYANNAAVQKAPYIENKGKWIWGFQDKIPLKNQTVVFLLTDKGTGSSGEDFVHYLSTADHVIRVGTNTAGVLQFGNVCEFFLPHSGLFVRMGSKVAFYGSTEILEGTGILPDLWVNAPDAMDAVVRMVEYYGLNSAESSLS